MCVRYGSAHDSRKFGYTLTQDVHGFRARRGPWLVVVNIGKIQLARSPTEMLQVIWQVSILVRNNGLVDLDTVCV